MVSIYHRACIALGEVSNIIYIRDIYRGRFKPDVSQMFTRKVLIFRLANLKPGQALDVFCSADRFIEQIIDHEVTKHFMLMKRLKYIKRYVIVLHVINK